MNVTPWSYSRVKLFEQCPKKYYHLHIVKDYREPPSSAMTYGNEVHAACEEYVRDGKELEREHQFVKPVLDALIQKQGKKLAEYRLGLTEDLEPCGFRDSNVWFRGIADLIILDEDNKLAWVIDYKTGKSARYADKDQLELMALAVFKHFPQVEVVRGGLLFVVSKDLIRDTYKEDEQELKWVKWNNKIDRMKIALNNDVWNPSPSGLCRNHCIVTECAHNGRS